MHVREIGCEDGNDSGLCPVGGFVISSVEPLDNIAGEKGAFMLK